MRSAIRHWLWIAVVLLPLASACESDDAENGGHDHGDHDDLDDHSDKGDGHDHDHDAAVPSTVDSGVAPVDGSVAGGFEWRLPSGFPRPAVPADNPMTPEKVELGRHVFYDKRLSDNQTFSCATCHKQEVAFADDRPVGFGSTGQFHTRGAMSLANVAYSPTLTWANPLMTELERQAQVPIFGDDPIELGMMSIEEVESRFRAVPRYQELFATAFPEATQPITMENLLKALSAFERTIISGNSAYDKFSNGDDAALSESAKRGMLFVTTNEDHRFECNHCHGGFNFSDHVTWEGLEQAGESPPYHQTGLYDLDGKGTYPDPNTGVYNTSLNPDDMGKFKAPTLRNVALTPPYMHDGSITTLSNVLEHYSKGGRARNASKTDPLLKTFPITAREKADIIAFLESLTDYDLLKDPAFSDPWPAEVNAVQQ
jgi:cytochrome c peroxidase